MKLAKTKIMKFWIHTTKIETHRIFSLERVKKQFEGTN